MQKWRIDRASSQGRSSPAETDFGEGEIINTLACVSRPRGFLWARNRKPNLGTQAMDTSPRIALIDNDRAWLETLSDFLGTKGWLVHTAEGGLRGLELLARNEVALVVVDFHMPDLDGLELIRQVRARCQNLRVLLLSSEEAPELPARSL